ncbi:AmmeMemoRadiSam system protein B [candidate division KSB3 bacterium]|uniref:AmmeMemoRadiSam system protein B n=1 Tax=candidate division KSB3 bacterium TaxID=2044937 RepID=A0A9D5Q6E7_9BACT|nr:AmmeMemoRadiSam system protein B [candidate division KSB3 bacterium]MBD3325665.1 AmmeMemoRadiSam system protein B [candidate division KSB3 bacterium]
MEYPKIRPISAFPLEIPEGQFICLQDPHRYAENPVFVAPETFAVIQFFDGRHTVKDIQDAYMRQYGMLVHAEQIQQIVEQLDQYFLLESPTFFAHVKHLRAEFASQPVRLSSHKGAAYPDKREALCQQLAAYFTDARGPGAVPQARSDSEPSTLKAIMAPHIDLNAGGPTYAWAHQALAASDADLFVILGTSHVEMRNFFALTRKSFETTFGKVATEQPFVEALADRLSYDSFEDELIHKTEHSIEFQLVFLQYLRQQLGRTDTPMTIVAMLCGGAMHEAIVGNRPVEDVSQLEESIRGLQAVLEQYPGACVIASVDFSHVGLRYGARQSPNTAQLATVERTDRTLLAAMEQGDHQSFVNHLHQNRNATQVCGVVPIYTLLRVLDGAQGTLLHYDRAELGSGSFVSFASMAWNAAV